jgi:hypothetical protein
MMAGRYLRIVMIFKLLLYQEISFYGQIVLIFEAVLINQILLDVGLKEYMGRLLHDF